MSFPHDDKPLFGEFDPPKDGQHMLGSMQKITIPRRRFTDDEVLDFVIVGVGSAGGVLLQRLARAGFEVVGFESGPFWDTERDWVSDEAGSHGLYWNDLRITGGEHPLALGANNSGRGVGGGSVHWPRLYPAFIHLTLRFIHGMVWERTGRSTMRTLSLTTSCSSGRCLLQDQLGIHGVSHMAIHTVHIPWAAWAIL